MGGTGALEIAFDFVTDVLAVFNFFYGLVDGEVRMLEAVVGNGVGAESRGFELARLGGRMRPPRHELGCARSVARTVAVGACFGLLLIVPHVRRRYGRDVLMVSRERGKGLGQRATPADPLSGRPDSTAMQDATASQKGVEGIRPRGFGFEKRRRSCGRWIRRRRSGRVRWPSSAASR